MQRLYTEEGALGSGMGIKLSDLDGYQCEQYSRKGKKRRKGGAPGGNRDEAKKAIEQELSTAAEAEVQVEEEAVVEPEAAVVSQADGGDTDVDALKAALAAEKEERAALEARLARMESQLAAAQSSPPAAAATVSQSDALGLATLQAQAATDMEAQEQRAILDTWMLESQLRIEDESRAQEQLASTASILELHQPREPMDTRLQSAQAAVDAAENRAAEQSRQVRNLTEELDAARAEQSRTAARLVEIEARLAQAETRASAAVAEAPVVEAAPAPEVAPEPAPAPEVVIESTDAPIDDGTLDVAVVEETLEVDSPFEGPAETEDGDTAVKEVADIAEEEESVLSAALAGWGLDEDTDLEGSGPPEGTVTLDLSEEESEAAAEESVSLEDELAAWGGSGDAADAAIEEVTESPAEAEDISVSLADELSAWGGADEAETGADPVEEAEPEAVATEDFTVEAEVVQVEEVEAAIDDGADEEESDEDASSMTIAADAEDGADSMMAALSAWGNIEQDTADVVQEEAAAGEKAEAEPVAQESTGAQQEEGKEAMLDALMRFMGP